MSCSFAIRMISSMSRYASTGFYLPLRGKLRQLGYDARIMYPLRINGYSFNTHFITCTEHADRNLTTVGNQYGFNFSHVLPPTSFHNCELSAFNFIDIWIFPILIDKIIYLDSSSFFMMSIIFIIIYNYYTIFSTYLKDYIN